MTRATKVYCGISGLIFAAAALRHAAATYDNWHMPDPDIGSVYGAALIGIAAAALAVWAFRLAAAPRESTPVNSFTVKEWRGSGPAALHVHHADDEAWHVIEGVLRFRFADRTVEAAAGETVIVPAGTAHTYEAVAARYLIVLTPRLAGLIAELQSSPDRSTHPAIYHAHESELLEAN